MRFETTSIRSMLGLRFRDATTERPVTDGLRVTVRRKDGAGHPTRAVRTVSGAYVAQGLTGLRAYERVPEDIPEDMSENDGGPEVDYLVDVRDRHGRFVPVLSEVELPYTPEQKHGGLYPVVDPPPEEEDEGNGTPEPTVYLFSAVQRPVPSGQAVIYADLVEKKGETWQPAAHAVMEVRHNPNNDNSNSNSDDSSSSNRNDGAVWYGIAGADGRVAVQFPLPALKHLGKSNGNGRLSNSTWQLDVSVLYEPSSLKIPGNTDWPLLPSIFQQKSGILYETKNASGIETLSPTLSYRDPLVLKTNDLSMLRIGPHDGL